MSNVRKNTLDQLLQKMQQTSDFPTLSESVSTISRIVSSERQSTAQLSNAILKDFSLTNKLLRMVNSAYYHQTSGGSISTVSRAVAVLGFDAVRNLTISALLFEHLQNKVDAELLKEEFLRTYLAGILARNIGTTTKLCEGEQAFICAMFCNLGRLLSHYYFPDESATIRHLAQQSGLNQNAAATKVLGISFDDLGMEIARNWGFPHLIVSSMRPLLRGTVAKPMAPEERLRVVSGFANELCDLIAGASPEQQQYDLTPIKERFRRSITLTEEELQHILLQSMDSLAQFSRIIEFELQQTGIGQRFQAAIDALSEADSEYDAQSESEEPPETDDEQANVEESLPITVLSDQETPGMPESTLRQSGATTPATNHVGAVLAAGIQDISNAMVEDFKPNDVLRIIMETIYRTNLFRRVILCFRDAKRNAMVGRFGFGPDAMDAAKRFNFPLSSAPDIFNAALSHNKDVLISDARAPAMQEHLPDWFGKKIGAETFVIFPLCIKGNPVAMIYADSERAGNILIPENELSLLRTLRNQAVLAIKHAA